MSPSDDLKAAVGRALSEHVQSIVTEEEDAAAIRVRERVGKLCRGSSQPTWWWRFLARVHSTQRSRSKVFTAAELRDVAQRCSAFREQQAARCDREEAEAADKAKLAKEFSYEQIFHGHSGRG